MEQLATFVLVLMLGGGGLLVALIVAAVSGSSTRARIKELERQVSELSDGTNPRATVRIRPKLGNLEPIEGRISHRGAD